MIQSTESTDISLESHMKIFALLSIVVIGTSVPLFDLFGSSIGSELKNALAFLWIPAMMFFAGYIKIFTAAGFMFLGNKIEPKYSQNIIFRLSQLVLVVTVFSGFLLGVVLSSDILIATLMAMLFFLAGWVFAAVLYAPKAPLEVSSLEQVVRPRLIKV